MGHEEEEIVCLRAKMALPEVKEIHVVDRRFAAFNFENDPAGVELEEVVRAKCELRRSEQTLLLALESELSSELKKRILDRTAASTRCPTALTRTNSASI